MTRLAVAVPVATVWTGPDAPRPEDAAAIADLPDIAGWTASMDAETRLGLHGRTLTQGLLGEPVELVAEHGDWAQVVLLEQPSSSDHRGYPGWVRKTHLSEVTAEQVDATVVVTVAVSTATTADEAVALSFGTRLPLLGRDGDQVRVALPGCGAATIPNQDVIAATPQADAEALLASARRFVGLPYLWGGASAWGMDCSGLVHLVHRVHGRRVPRDAFDQASGAVDVPVSDATAGDLYFFGPAGERISHVGFVAGRRGAGRTMLHAPEDGRGIEEEPLAAHRQSTLAAAGSFLREAVA